MLFPKTSRLSRANSYSRYLSRTLQILLEGHTHHHILKDFFSFLAHFVFIKPTLQGPSTFEWRATPLQWKCRSRHHYEDHHKEKPDLT